MKRQQEKTKANNLKEAANENERKQILVEYAKMQGADLIGFASIDRFSSVEPARHPGSIFPECMTVIVLGRRILRGALRGVEEGTCFESNYTFFGHRWLEDNFLSKTTYDITCFLEEYGYEAVPLFGYPPNAKMDYGIPVGERKPAPNVIIDQYFAAHQAGLGSVGKGGFFLTPEFGPRQRFALILTDCRVAADPVIELDFCDGCEECISACPLNAFDKEGNRDETICKSCKNGAELIPGRGGIMDRLAAACARSCIISLEKRKKLKNNFVNPFRKRKPWALDVYGRPIFGRK